MPIDLIIVSTVILIGIIFLLLEIFLLPGVGIAGIAGTLFVLGGIVYAYVYIGSTQGNILLISSAVLFGGSFLLLIRSKSLRKISLTAEIDATVDNSDLKKIAVGDTGRTVSRLNPIGKVDINGVRVEGKSVDGEMIDENTEIEVTKVELSNVLVKRKTNHLSYN
jgi:membrane-bound ClpP family serine protease